MSQYAFGISFNQLSEKQHELKSTMLVWVDQLF